MDPDEAAVRPVRDGRRLFGTGIFGFGFPLGAYGVAFRQNELVVSNTEGARLIRISINPDGSAGSATVLAGGPALLAVDGITFDVHGNVWAAIIAQSTIVRVSPSGTVRTVATAANGLDWAPSIAFGKDHDLGPSISPLARPADPDPRAFASPSGLRDSRFLRRHFTMWSTPEFPMGNVTDAPAGGPYLDSGHGSLVDLAAPDPIQRPLDCWNHLGLPADHARQRRRSTLDG